MLKIGRGKPNINQFYEDIHIPNMCPVVAALDNNISYRDFIEHLYGIASNVMNFINHTTPHQRSQQGDVTMRTPDNVLYEDEFWVIRNCGPRMWSAHRKSDGEHRLYWSFESLERDFGRIEPSTWGED